MNDDLYDDIFDQLYSECTPSLDQLEEEEFDEETPVNYLVYLDGERQIEIIEEICDDYDVPLSDRRQVKFNVILGKSPSTSVGNVDRKREEEGLEPVSEILEGEDLE